MRAVVFDVCETLVDGLPAGEQHGVDRVPLAAGSLAEALPDV